MSARDLHNPVLGVQTGQTLLPGLGSMARHLPQISARCPPALPGLLGASMGAQVIAQNPPQRHNILQLATTGFYFCTRCQKVTAVDGESFRKCRLCGSHSVKWCPAVPFNQ